MCSEQCSAHAKQAASVVLDTITVMLIDEFCAAVVTNPKVQFSFENTSDAETLYFAMGSAFTALAKFLQVPSSWNVLHVESQ